MTVTKSSWVSAGGKTYDVYYNVGEDDVFVNAGQAAGQWEDKPGATIPTLISQGEQPQGPIDSIVVASAHTLRVRGHEHTFYPVEFVTGYNEFGAEWGNSVPTGTVLYVEPDGQLRPA
jgi:hypothetical protein